MLYLMINKGNSFKLNTVYHVVSALTALVFHAMMSLYLPATLLHPEVGESNY